jgi:hypothetical protein
MKYFFGAKLAAAKGPATSQLHPQTQTSFII